LKLVLSNQVDCHYRALDEILNKALSITKNKDCDFVYEIYKYIVILFIDFA